MQRKHKVNKEKWTAINESGRNMKEACFIIETKYSTWLENMVVVLKSYHRSKACVNFTYLNTTFTKDPYHLPNIDKFIDESSGYKNMSFMKPNLDINR